MEAVDITDGRTIFAARKDMVLNVEEMIEMTVADGFPVLWHITVGLM